MEEESGIALEIIKSKEYEIAEEVKGLYDLPNHLQDCLKSNCGDGKYPKKGLTAEGFLRIKSIHRGLDTTVEVLPWEKESKLHKKPHERTWKESKGGLLTRGQRQATAPASMEHVNKYKKFDNMMSTMKYNKVSFINPSADCEAVPKWAKYRMENSCKTVRYELPFEKKLLEDMTPLDFLANYTRLCPEPTRRYTKVFVRYKAKSTDVLQYENLYDALDSMFGNYLTRPNFDILCTALFIEDDSEIDLKTFIGICAWTDRLFWATYLDQSEDTFYYWGPNRTALEYIDFCYLGRKLEGYTLSKEMSVLLHSLA